MSMPIPFRPGRSGRRGMALLIVMVSLLLLTILVVGLLVRAGTESRSSSHYVADAGIQKLSDMVVNLVQAQINHATGQGAAKVWVSQPGAVRLFNADGSLSLVYKLYSASMLTTSDATTLANDVPAAAWTTQAPIWTDLNAPVTTTGLDGASRTSFPVLDPRNPANLSAIAAIEGFALAATPGATTAQPAPMPVQWLYVLQDGSLVPPVAGGSSRVVSVAGASKANPIVGRIAFWTDDETCKVNINTAGDGTFWDTPHWNKPDERTLATYQPAQGEYQRYPGHPGTTTLQKVFQGIAVPTPLTSSQVFSLTPRYTWGGSQGGTQTAPAAIPKKTSRLFSSVGELLFDPTRNPAGLLTSQQLETGRFFLTAHSSAPELTLSGTPRVAIWPLHDTNDAAHRTAIDKLIAFCSTLNGNAYYFTRSDPVSPTADITLSRNAKILGYLDHLTSAAIPGYSGTFSGKYGVTGMRQILTEIFDYVRAVNIDDPTVASPYMPVVSNPKGGAPGTIAPSLAAAWGTKGFGRFPTLTEASFLFVAMGKGPVTGSSPADPGVPVDSRQPSAQFTSSPVPYAGTDSHGTPPADKTAVQPFLLLNFFNPAHGFSGMWEGFTITVSGLDQFTLNGNPLGFPATATEVLKDFNPISILNDAVPYVGVIDFRTLMANRPLGPDPGRNPFFGSILEVPTTAATMNLAGAGGAGTVSLTISVYSGNAVAAANLVCTYNISVPPLTLATPLVTAAPILLGNPAVSNATAKPDPITHNVGPDRLDTVQSSGAWRTVLTNETNDTLFSMIPTAAWSDYRALALATSVPASAFTVHPNQATQRFAWMSREPITNKIVGATAGKLVAGLSDGLVPPTADLTTRAVPPDWDNGLPQSDTAGPYINKADEGTTNHIGSSLVPYYDNTWEGQTTAPTFFSANRQIPSPGMFGSLSTGTTETPAKLWQTLLFRPGPSGHPGLNAPLDSLLLDLFWMPVVEPYAISEPLATMGKVNMNYQIVPFTYITRNTALRSVLASEKVAMLDAAGSSGTARVALNLSDTDGTLRPFREKFAANGLFKSASEICSVYLVPNGQSWSSDAAANSAWYGTAFAGVGDNVRERPYADIYPRLTTKSNSFKVFYRVQALQNPSAADPGQWNEDGGAITGDQRGSAVVERYIDPADVNVPDYATNLAAASLETFYRWRVVESTLFTP